MPMRFPGQYADDETGFSYNHFRDYEPELGRYTESDPIGLMAGPNTYAYVRGNPLQFRDPWGWSPAADPNDVVPGGPWTPDPSQPGYWKGPKPARGPQSSCKWVPQESEGGPKGSEGYWKRNNGTDRGWQRYDSTGRPISPEEAHPGRPTTPPGTKPVAPDAPTSEPGPKTGGEECPCTEPPVSEPAPPPVVEPAPSPSPGTVPELPEVPEIPIIEIPL
jgi:RHS repeat-associated protein